MAYPPSCSSDGDLEPEPDAIGSDSSSGFRTDAGLVRFLNILLVCDARYIGCLMEIREQEMTGTKSTGESASVCVTYFSTLISVHSQLPFLIASISIGISSRISIVPSMR